VILLALTRRHAPTRNGLKEMPIASERVGTSYRNTSAWVEER